MVKSIKNFFNNLLSSKKRSRKVIQKGGYYIKTTASDGKLIQVPHSKGEEGLKQELEKYEKKIKGNIIKINYNPAHQLGWSNKKGTHTLKTSGKSNNHHRQVKESLNMHNTGNVHSSQKRHMINKTKIQRIDSDMWAKGLDHSRNLNVLKKTHVIKRNRDYGNAITPAEAREIKYTKNNTGEIKLSMQPTRSNLAKAAYNLREKNGIHSTAYGQKGLFKAFSNEHLNRTGLNNRTNHNSNMNRILKRTEQENRTALNKYNNKIRENINNLDTDSIDYINSKISLLRTLSHMTYSEKTELKKLEKQFMTLNQQARNYIRPVERDVYKTEEKRKSRKSSSRKSSSRNMLDEPEPLQPYSNEEEIYPNYV